MIPLCRFCDFWRFIAICKKFWRCSSKTDSRDSARQIHKERWIWSKVQTNFLFCVLVKLTSCINYVKLTAKNTGKFQQCKCGYQRVFWPVARNRLQEREHLNLVEPSALNLTGITFKNKIVLYLIVFCFLVWAGAFSIYPRSWHIDTTIENEMLNLIREYTLCIS